MALVPCDKIASIFKYKTVSVGTITIDSRGEAYYVLPTAPTGYRYFDAQLSYYSGSNHGVISTFFNGLGSTASNIYFLSTVPNDSISGVKVSVKYIDNNYWEAMT